MITAVGLSPGNRCDPPGIPYYLPKPLLVISKNVRHIDESKVGLTGPVPIPGGFDNQAAYGDIKANVTVPSGPGGEGKAAAALAATPISDAIVSKSKLEEGDSKSTTTPVMTPASTDRFNGGIELDSFFTYQIIFVPDLSQKYGLQISGGAGEFRAAMNMVNGWMYTGMGPFYMKDSSSAQNAMATGVAAMYAGRGVSDVVSQVGDLASSFAGLPNQQAGLTDAQLMDINTQVKALEVLANMTPKVPMEMLNYAEIYIYEPHLLPDQSTEWRLVAEHCFNRHYFSTTDDVAVQQAREAVLNKMLNGVMSHPAFGDAPKTEPQTYQPATPGQQQSGTSDEPDGGRATMGGGSGMSSGIGTQQVERLNLVPPVHAPPASSVEVNVNSEVVAPSSAVPPQHQRLRDLLPGRPTIEQRTGNQTIEVR